MEMSLVVLTFDNELEQASGAASVYAGFEKIGIRN
jgi:hypothetical protein